MSVTKRNCDECSKEYFADNRNLSMGWGLTCSKKCAAKKREKRKPNYNPIRVSINNERRRNWNDNYYNEGGYNPDNYDHPFSSEAHGQE